MYGVSSVTLKLIAHRETPMCITSWQLFLGGLLLTAAGFSDRGPHRGIPAFLCAAFILHGAAFYGGFQSVEYAAEV